ncbi:MAG: outer membrane beta-barrel protein [Paludibacteraceae bacterium]|nr:outer membrane beta-barrel protein [Paludibacteraceae bacterium]
MERTGYILVFLCLFAGVLWADDKVKPAMQIEDNTFFDPSRKEVSHEQYRFSVEYRIEAGFTQHEQRARDLSYQGMFLNGVRVGATFTFNLPLHFGLQTGLLYTLVYGTNEQHWRSMDAPSVQTEYITHRVLEHDFTVPVRLYYTIPVWKKLSLFVFTGPQLQIGLAENDYMQLHLSEGTQNWLNGQGIPTSPYDRMTDELVRANIQWGVGGGIEWDRYRLQGGYDFGLNNLVKHPLVKGQYMSEWGWFASFSYRF